MKSTNIVELSPNDGWYSAVRKINANFDNMHGSVVSDSKANVEASLHAVNDRIDELDSRTRRSLADLETSMEIGFRKTSESIDAIESKLSLISETLERMSVPGIGEYVMSDADPSSVYEGTEWDRIQGTQVPTWKRVS